MKHTEETIKNIAHSISNPSYNDNLQATKELVELFDNLKETSPNDYITRKPLDKWEDYVQMYDDNFYTYPTLDALIESEEEQNDGLTASECIAEIGNTIWQLPCGWYVQYV